MSYKKLLHDSSLGMVLQMLQFRNKASYETMQKDPTIPQSYDREERQGDYPMQQV